MRETKEGENHKRKKGDRPSGKKGVLIDPGIKDKIKSVKGKRKEGGWGRRRWGERGVKTKKVFLIFWERQGFWGETGTFFCGFEDSRKEVGKGKTKKKVKKCPDLEKADRGHLGSRKKGKRGGRLDRCGGKNGEKEQGRGGEVGRVSGKKGTNLTPGREEGGRKRGDRKKKTPGTSTKKEGWERI